MSKTEKNQLPKKRMSNRMLGASAAAIALALIATPFLGSTADAALDTGKFCIQAVNTEDATITGKGGACRSGNPTGPEIPGEVPSEFELAYSANIGGFRSAAVFMVDNLTGEERQLSDYEPGAMSGSTWVFDAPAESTGWKMQARSGGTVIAEASIAPSDLKEHDGGGGWIYKRASVALVNLPVEIEIFSTINATSDHTNGANVVSEPYSYKVVDDSTGEIVVSGEAMTGPREGRIRFSTTSVIPSNKLVGLDLSAAGAISTWTISFVYRGETYTKQTDGSAVLIGNAEPLKWEVKPNHNGYTLSHIYPGMIID